MVNSDEARQNTKRNRNQNSQLRRGIILVYTKRNQNSQLRRCRITKIVLTHVALCGLEHRQQTDKIFNRVPRGIRSRTHTVYHADADKVDSDHDPDPTLLAVVMQVRRPYSPLNHPFPEQPGPRRGPHCAAVNPEAAAAHWDNRAAALLLGLGRGLKLEAGIVAPCVINTHTCGCKAQVPLERPRPANGKGACLITPWPAGVSPHHMYTI